MYDVPDEKTNNFEFGILMAFVVLFFVFFVLTQCAPKYREVVTYETREEALRHCNEPMQVAGPLNEAPRGWRCPN